MALGSCVGGVPLLDGVINPFRDLPPIAMDGMPHDLTADLVPLGELEAGQVVRIEVAGEFIDDVLVLIEDGVFAEAGVIAGGGPPNAPFNYRVQRAGGYFVYVQFDPLAAPTERVGTITVSSGDETFRPPARQAVLVEFADGYLSEPGLFDPVSGTDDERQLLENISEQVRGEVLAELRRIFAATPVDILDERDPLPASPFSRLTYVPDRVVADDQAFIDATLPPPDPERPECQVRVLFGEVLPIGSRQDTGNRTPDDEAVVYVGSFQGRGVTCRTAATDSVNNAVLALAHTGAHEIGHLLGLQHIEQVGIMNRSATLALLRELALTRGQIQIDTNLNGEVVTTVLTTVIQDPAVYFQTAFDANAEPVSTRANSSVSGQR